MVELLICKGAKVNAKDINEDTPLDWAVREGQREVVKLLKLVGEKALFFVIE